jgi:hypothetical protein
MKNIIFHKVPAVLIHIHGKGKDMKERSEQAGGLLEKLQEFLNKNKILPAVGIISGSSGSGSYYSFYTRRDADRIHAWLKRQKRKA